MSFREPHIEGMAAFKKGAHMTPVFSKFICAPYN